MHGTARAALVVVSGLLLAPGAQATPFTPLEWQREVKQSSDPRFMGQRKHVNWVRDTGNDFIDDEIQQRFRPGDKLDVIVELNTVLACAPALAARLATFGAVLYVSRTVTFVILGDVLFDALPELAALPEVAMVEWRQPLFAMNDVGSRSVQSRSSATYPGRAAQDLGFTGRGVTIAIIDTGTQDMAGQHEALQGKFVGGYNTGTDSEVNPHSSDAHGTHVAGIAMGLPTAGRSCRTPDDGSPTDCAGVAPDASLVDIRACTSVASCLFLPHAVDWLAANAVRLGVKVANISIGGCGRDDGTEALAVQANYLAAIGVVVVAAHGNAPNCRLTPGSRTSGAPASASLAIAVAGLDDRGTVSRADDVPFSGHLIGPRVDFVGATSDLAGLKPDLAAPGEAIVSARADTTDQYQAQTGTSMAAPHVSGAAALLLQARPGMNPGSVKRVLLASADSGANTPAFPAVHPTWDTHRGHGKLDAFQALRVAAGGDVRFPSCIGGAATPEGLCNLAAPQPPWNNSADITSREPPRRGVPNAITVNLRNDGDVRAVFQVNVGTYVFGAGTHEFHHLGTVPVTMEPRTSTSVTVPWTPAEESHQCIQASIDHGGDTDFTNNVTQRNLEIAASTYDVRVENPFFSPARFEVTATSDRAGWLCELDEPAFELGPMDCPRTLQVRFDGPAAAQPGERASCNVAIHATPASTGVRRLLGGVTVQTFIPSPCRIPGRVVGVSGAGLAARLVFRKIEERPGLVHPGPAEVEVTAGADGRFTVVLTPGISYAVRATAGTLTGTTTWKPLCADGLRFVLDDSGLQLTVVAPAEVVGGTGPGCACGSRSGGSTDTLLSRLGPGLAAVLLLRRWRVRRACLGARRR